LWLDDFYWGSFFGLLLAFIEGSDPILKDEYIFVTAHYDHLGGVDETIYFGADDNASGTSGVMEIARAFVQAEQSRP
jgi:Zn-dependent M28 family amino/carboxypeptidase